MSNNSHAAIVKPPFFTPGVCVVAIIALIGLTGIGARFLFGLGHVTNLNNQFPWGLWIGVDVACGVALAAGGFTSAFIAEILMKEDFHDIVRP
ncbi:MAG: Ni/Fe-hydrogenase cytochrome b subunit, partial [Desulfobulbaceae bacterium]|nr:Ni/Fe-hydrogenase cytochrome b subunit [Desulfobulbaceae bacterium]